MPDDRSIAIKPGPKLRLPVTLQGHRHSKEDYCSQNEDKSPDMVCLTLQQRLRAKESTIMVFPMAPGLLSRLGSQSPSFLLTLPGLFSLGPQTLSCRAVCGPEMDGGGCPSRRKHELYPAANIRSQPGHPAGSERQTAFQVENSKRCVGIHLGSLEIFF